MWSQLLAARAGWSTHTEASVDSDKESIQNHVNGNLFRHLSRTFIFYLTSASSTLVKVKAFSLLFLCLFMPLYILSSQSLGMELLGSDYLWLILFLTVIYFFVPQFLWQHNVENNGAYCVGLWRCIHGSSSGCGAFTNAGIPYSFFQTHQGSRLFAVHV